MTNNKSEKMCALVVDDEEHIRNYLTSILKDIGFDSIYHASNGKDGIDLFRNLTPHLTLLDIVMPKMDGITALKEIRGIDPDACIIMLTSVDTENSINKCLNCTASNYILKDTCHTQIIEIIKYSIGKSRKVQG